VTVGFVKTLHQGLDVVAIVILECKIDMDDGIVLKELIDSSEVSLMGGKVWMGNRDGGKRRY
jgi:hypothetical protein